MEKDVTCRICELTALELQLCAIHLDDYYYWKKQSGYLNDSTNRVAEYEISYEDFIEE